MIYFHWIAGCILALAWFSRLVSAARGVPQVTNIATDEWNRTPPGTPHVTIIVPARNEEAHVEQSLSQLLELDYPNYEVIAVNDRSTDRTGEVMDRVAATPAAHGRLRVIHISDLPPGWLGKAHAMWTAAKEASGEWILFTDADVMFEPDVLKRSLSYAIAERADHMVLFPSFVMHNAGERMMIAFFQTLFVFGHRPWKVADPKTKDFMGVGAFNLIRRSTYEAIGSYQALRFEVLDDMKLGKLVKAAGFAQRNVFGHGLITIRWAHGAMGVVQNLTKNMFAVMSFRPLMTLLGAATLGFLNLVPFFGLLFAHGWARLPYAVALASMFGIYVGMSWMSDVPPYYFALHPASSLLFVYIVLRSMVLTLARGGVIWRGTFYPLEELRKGLV